MADSTGLVEELVTCLNNLVEVTGQEVPTEVMWHAERAIQEARFGDFATSQLNIATFETLLTAVLNNPCEEV